MGLEMVSPKARSDSNSLSFMLLHYFYLEHNGETLQDLMLVKEVMSFIIFRMIHLMEVQRVDCLGWH